MEALITAHTTYNIMIGGHAYNGFTLVDKWEGMLKFKDSHGRVAILDPEGQNPLEGWIQKILCTTQEETVEEWKATEIKLSPSSIPAGDTNR